MLFCIIIAQQRFKISYWLLLSSHFIAHLRSLFFSERSRYIGFVGFASTERTVWCIAIPPQRLFSSWDTLNTFFFSLQSLLCDFWEICVLSVILYHKRTSEAPKFSFWLHFIAHLTLLQIILNDHVLLGLLVLSQQNAQFHVQPCPHSVCLVLGTLWKAFFLYKFIGATFGKSAFYMLICIINAHQRL